MNAKDRMKNLILNQEELLVVYVGDSHMWGEGADGWNSALKPAAVAGELRRLPDDIPSFSRLYTDYLKEIRKGKSGTYTINSAFGSTSTKKYLSYYWNQGVDIYKPDIVVIEFAINDWLEQNAVSLEEFHCNIEYMIKRTIMIGAVPVVLTVSPILGSLYSGKNYYPDYIEATRKIAGGRDDVILADANRLMEDYLNSGDRERKEAELFDDCWHVAQKGQQFYLQALINATGLE